MISKWRRRSILLRKKSLNILFARRGECSFSPAAWMAVFSLFFLLKNNINDSYLLIVSLMIFVLLSIISLIDIEYFVIAEIPLICLTFIASFYLFFVHQNDLQIHLIAAIIGFFFIKFISMLYFYVRKIEAIGSGDAKLFAFAGFCLGIDGLASTLFFSLISAMLMCLIAIRAGNLKSNNEPVPFGPHLSLGIWLVWVFGPVQIG